MLQVDVDEDMATAQDLGVQSLPTLIVFSDGTDTARLDGLIGDEDLEAAVSSAV